MNELKSTLSSAFLFFPKIQYNIIVRRIGKWRKEFTMNKKMKKQLDLMVKRSDTKKALQEERNTHRLRWNGIRPTVMQNKKRKAKMKNWAADDW